MMNLTGYSSFLIQLTNKIGTLAILWSIMVFATGYAQTGSSPTSSLSLQQESISHDTQKQLGFNTILSADSLQPDKGKYPDPNKVLYRSLMIPGWGQVINDQVWKVPIIYALLGGLTYYSIHLTKRYHDYRAAFYNLSNQNQDQRFGPTPGYLQDETSNESLKNTRNFYRNRRDFVYVTIGLAYGLNAVDAYVFAHMRSFSVSDDLSIRPKIEPGVQYQSPMLTMRFQLMPR